MVAVIFNRMPINRTSEISFYDHFCLYYSCRESSDGATQPPLLSFKNFLLDQDDNIDQEEAVKRYGDYKNDFKKTQIAEFFTAHKDEEWFVNILR